MILSCSQNPPKWVRFYLLGKKNWEKPGHSKFQSVSIYIIFILRVRFSWSVFCTSVAFHIKIRNDCSEQVCVLWSCILGTRVLLSESSVRYEAWALASLQRGVYGSVDVGP